MADYRKVFPKRNTLLIVVHAVSEEQVLRNVSVALKGGADGVFLINHSIPAGELLRYYATVRMQYPRRWIGLNLLDLMPHETVIFLPPRTSGVWFDDIGIAEDKEEPDSMARAVRDVHQAFAKEALLFGGVAFKYRQPVRDLRRVAQLAVPHTDVLTTSGDATGVAADPEKIRVMKRAIGNHPLAIASGVTVENVNQYMKWADCFLVATGVSDTHTELNASKVHALAERVRNS